MKWIYKKVFELILSCELISLLIATIIFNFTSKFHLIHLVSVFTLFYHYSHDFYFFDHGMYNFGFFIILFILNLIVILFLKIIIWLFKIENKIIINKLILSIVLLLIYNFNLPNFTCDDWEKGLNNTSIDNDDEKYGCKIKYPEYCQYKVLSKYQDLTKILGIDCSHKYSNARKKFLKDSNSPYITKYTKKFGFPYTNKGFFGSNDLLDYKVLKQHVVNNLFDVDNNFNNFSNPEIIVDFSKDPTGELIIDLKYNDSLSKERKKLENLNIPYSNNILVLFFDSVSRVASLKQLNKTLKFVESFMSYEGGYNDKYPDEKFHSFQFFKYHPFEGRIYQLLKPKDIKDKKKVRIGKKGDGGYVLFNDFKNIKIAYSFGISNEISFDKELSEKNIDIFMYDHTIEKINEPNSKFHWKKIGLSGKKETNNNLKTLKDIIKENGHTREKDMILKMDIEGYEWDSFLYMNFNILRQFKYIIVEFHFSDSYKSIYSKVLKKLNKTHQIFHLHCNNCGQYINFDGYNICNSLEVSYVIRQGNTFTKYNENNSKNDVDYNNCNNRPDLNHLLKIYQIL